MREQRSDSPLRAQAAGRELNPSERSLRARLAAYAKHGQSDGRAATAKARTAFLARFELEADPEGVLPLDERRRRAERLRKAYFTRLALASARARRASSGGSDAA
jgi:hypothetical protein